MHLIIGIVLLTYSVWAGPHEDQGDTIGGKKVGHWIEYTEESRAAYYEREGDYVNGKREGLWSEKRISWKGEVYEVNKLRYSNGILLKKEKDYVQEFEIKKAQEDTKLAARKSLEANLRNAVGEKEYKEKTEITFPRQKYNLTNGPFTGCYKNGMKHEEGFLKNGKLDGQYILYTENGYKWELHNYIDGVLDGQFIRWFYNSSVKWHERTYKQGLLDGYNTIYFGNAQLQEKTLYHNGKKQGESFAWYKNGQKQKEAEYIDDKEHGAYRLWYKNGKIRDDAVYKNGQLVSCRYLKGKICSMPEDSMQRK